MQEAKTLIAVTLTFLLAACSSTPTWEGMSEAEIASWQRQGVAADWAQTLSAAGVDASGYESWTDAGIASGEAILLWLGEGFAADAAGAWNAAGFEARTARQWSEKAFTAEQAKRWMTAGFDLRDAIKQRAKGLAPIS
ncbi:MAG: hypothetical protein V2J24_13230 [Pseudomonadales bacterium]|jgi:hypothetical protein|nr:hypothetical protein [Pseudomonadales bacterium]